MEERRYSWNNSADKLPNVENWSQHANVHNDFSDQDKFPSSNFHYPLTDQKPCIEEATVPRAMVCQVQNAGLHNPEVERAVNRVSSNFAVQFGEMQRSGNAYHDDIDDILENIDVDQMVMEYYQSTHKPQPSISKVPSVTPVASKGNFEGPEKTSLPPELCMKCIHGHNLGSCPEASVHLQELKDIRIGILNDLLDNNIINLNVDQIEMLHQVRVQLNTQIQQLEEHLRATSLSYCENDVDCQRVYFGENFDSVNCQKACDKCSKTQNCMEKDVTTIAKHLVELVKMTGQQFSSAHILEVYRGSLNQFVKKHKHETLSLHGAGKHLPEGKASHVLHHLVIEDVLMEDIDIGSLSYVLKVNNFAAYNLFSGSRAITLRSEETPAKVPLISGKQSPPEVVGQPENQVDLNLSAKIYSALGILRDTFVEESTIEGTVGYHIFGTVVLKEMSKRMPRTKDELRKIGGIGEFKLSKYGDRVLETIEATIREHYKTEKNGGSSSNESVKRRRKTDDRLKTYPVAS